MFDSFNWVTAGMVFAVYVVVDIVYALYVLSVSRGHPLSAACYGSAIYTLGAYGVLTYSENPLYLVPLAAGAFLGTFLVVKYKKD